MHLRLEWQHDAAGRPLSQRLSRGSRVERQRRYHWQAGEQLTETEDSLSGTTAFSYDAVGHLASARYADGEQQLRQPDAVGNLFRTAARTDRTYGRGGQLREAGGTRYAYDGEGNLVRKTLPDGRQWRYAWDGAGQLAEVTRPDGYAVRFSYDAFGRRVSKRFRGRVTHWVWDGDKPLHEWHELVVGPGAGSASEVLTWLFEEESFAPAAKLSALGAQSVVCDHLGTPLTLHDGQGVVTWELNLDSYGGVRQGRGRAQDCPFRYQGQYEDTETGLYYNRFRYYDPEAGRYISQDPLKLSGGLSSLYGYVLNSNSSFDPLGLISVCETFQHKLSITERWVKQLTGKSATDVEAELVNKGWTKSYPQAARPDAIQHTAFTRTTRAGKTYVLDYHPGSTLTQANIHGTPYWKVYGEVQGEVQVFGRIGPKGFSNYDMITDSPVFIDGLLAN